MPPKKLSILSPSDVTQWLDKEKVEFIHTVPSHLRSLMSDPNLHLHPMSYLKYILLSGERIFPNDIKNWINFLERCSCLCFFIHSRFFIFLQKPIGPDLTHPLKTRSLLQPIINASQKRKREREIPHSPEILFSLASPQVCFPLTVV